MIEYTVKVFPDAKRWYLDELLHREDGPAIEYTNGDKYWWLNGKLHRENGPAVEWSNGDKYWFLNGEEVTKEEVMDPVEEMTMEEICKALGKNVKVTK